MEKYGHRLLRTPPCLFKNQNPIMILLSEHFVKVPEHLPFRHEIQLITTQLLLRKEHIQDEYTFLTNPSTTFLKAICVPRLKKSIRKIEKMEKGKLRYGIIFIRARMKPERSYFFRFTKSNFIYEERHLCIHDCSLLSALGFCSALVQVFTRSSITNKHQTPKKDTAQKIFVKNQMHLKKLVRSFIFELCVYSLRLDGSENGSYWSFTLFYNADPSICRTVL